MRLLLFLALATVALAGATEAAEARPAAPRGLALKLPAIPWWNSAENARVAALRPTFAAIPARPRLDLPLLPYPALAPPQARGYLLFQ